MPDYKSPGVYVEEVPPISRPIAGVGTSTPGFIGVIPDTINLPARPQQTDPNTDITRGYKWTSFTVPAVANKAYSITGWTQYTQLFGDFIGDETAAALTTGSPDFDSGQRKLAHAIFGFFNNGGQSCYVIRISAITDIDKALNEFAAIDEISIVAAPGLTGTTNYNKLSTHCKNLEDRVAILDPVESDPAFTTGDFAKLKAPTNATPAGLRPPNTDYAAFYFPWIQVFDPAIKLTQPSGDGLIYMPPSGHIAGIYARSDGKYGPHKAPANEAVSGAEGLRWPLSKINQADLNGDGVNIIRSLNGDIRVWGARTVGGDANGEYKYISTRRFFNYLRESIDEGMQFVVFEPNTPALWQRITRTASDFLLRQWQDGRLFGETPQKAFYVKCDKDTNPSNLRDMGQVVTEIGVAIVKPAEFVIFRIQQTTGG